MASPRPEIQAKDFYIFGSNISFSKSPILHQAAFKYHNLPHTYTIHQTPSTSPLSPLITAPTFGGASVTMPHKLSISTYCTSVSSHAKLIGAINTLVVIRDENGERTGIRGDNSDWSGLVSCLKTKGESVLKEAKVGLVIGAGGASRAALYALHQLGIKDIFLVNRTQATAEKIAEEFSELFKITVVPNLREAEVKPDVIIGTIPADQTTTDYFPIGLFAAERGICVDMAYKPRETPLLKVAKSREGWETVTGVEVLLAQAFVQSEWWLGIPAPQQEMVQALEEHDLESEAKDKISGKL
ncbi:putative pentafunctional AROM polypeptide [Hyaloscypha variabilis F]|uniref:Putative pentafunctional AROM polypeptide n=1 Tax=Hyaloscypha variabilis (strain UAMH 11265 / GT02V1 / F) TaxID=1149755 RepID=A0A2J6R3W2_HYAVF|nr:putative pentafunctional AROM polypeptide [Hyaloscypha variabilis F]